MSGESARRSTKSGSFMQSRYDNWKKALEKGRGFDRNEKADYHRKAILTYEIPLSSAIGDLCDMKLKPMMQSALKIVKYC